MGFGATVKAAKFKGKQVELPRGRWKDVSLETRFSKPIEDALKREGGKKRVLMKYELFTPLYPVIPQYIVVTPKSVCLVAFGKLEVLKK